MGAEECETTDMVRIVVRPGIQSGVGGRGMRSAEAIPRRVVRDKRRLVQLDRKPEEQREVVLNERVIVRAKIVVVDSLFPLYDGRGSVRIHPDQFRRIPPLLMEGRLDHLVVSVEDDALVWPTA